MWRRLLIAIVVTVGALIAAGLVLVLIVVEATGKSASYDTMGEAYSAGAVGRGWVPSFLPEAAYEIAEAHDLDTNERCSRASLPAGHAPEIERRLAAGGFYRLERRPPPSHPVDHLAPVMPIRSTQGGGRCPTLAPICTEQC